LNPYRNLFLILFFGANILFLAACALTGAVPAAQNSAPAAQPTVAPQSAQSDQATATNAPAAAAATATQPAPVLSADEVYKAVQTAWAKLEKAGPRHISQNLYKGSTVVSNTEADSVPPNIHMVMSMNGTVFAEQYIYNGTIYNKLKGEWTQFALAGTAFKSTLAGFAEGLAGQIVLADGKVMGIEMINGKAATEYSYTSSLKGLSAPPITHMVWVDNASGLPLKQEILKANGDKTVQLITYDANIQLTLPDEAKNAKTAK